MSLDRANEVHSGVRSTKNEAEHGDSSNGSATALGGFARRVSDRVQNAAGDPETKTGSGIGGELDTSDGGREEDGREGFEGVLVCALRAVEEVRLPSVLGLRDLSIHLRVVDLRGLASAGDAEGLPDVEPEGGSEGACDVGVFSGDDDAGG